MSLPLLFLLPAVACRPAAAPPANPDESAEITAVEAVLARWNAAMSAHDSAGTAAPLLPSFFIFEDTTRIGRDDLVRDVVKGFEAGSQTAAMSNFETQVRGNVAWTSFRNNEVWTPKTGRPDSLHFLETVVGPLKEERVYRYSTWRDAFVSSSRKKMDNG